MKKFFFAGGDLLSNNRGCQALGYGGISFINSTFINSSSVKIIIPLFTRKEIKSYNNKMSFISNSLVELKNYTYTDIIVAWFELILLKRKKNRVKNKLSKDLLDTEYIFNVNGGDSFSDIYGIKQFLIFTLPSIVALLFHKHHIFLPQTIGPFKKGYIKKFAKFILQRTEQVFVRDTEFSKQLVEWGIAFKEVTDLSSRMETQIIHNLDNFDRLKGAIGFNVSSLAYFDDYKHLKGRFNHYKSLCIEIIQNFQKENKAIWLVPHTYKIEEDVVSDDLLAIHDLFNSLPTKQGVYIINEDFNAMELKYIISKFSFFIGTRMHACFAAIFTGVPVFGLAYSYKFKGGFEKAGLIDNCYDIVDLQEEDFDEVISKIKSKYCLIQKNC